MQFFLAFVAGIPYIATIMLRNTIFKAIQRLGAAVIAALALLSCKPLDEPEIPQKGYWYILEIPASVTFPLTGGSYTVAPYGVVYYDGEMVRRNQLTESEVEIRCVDGNDDFVIQGGLTFSTGQVQGTQWAYYELIWKENGATAYMAVAQRKNVY